MLIIYRDLTVNLFSGMVLILLPVVVVVAVLLLVLNINARGGMTFTFNELLATPRGIQELMNDKGHNHQILVHIDGVRTYVRVASAPPNRARIKQDFAVVEQQDANTFIVHAIDRPDELYQVSSRPEVDSISWLFLSHGLDWFQEY